MPAITPDLLERARGAMVGAAIGDAFGMPLDGAPLQPLNRQARELRRGRLNAGQFGEATAAMLVVSEGLLTPEPTPPEEIAARLLEMRPAPAPASSLPALLRPARVPTAPPADGPPVQTLAHYLPVALYHIADRNAALSLARELGRCLHEPADRVGGGAFVTALLWNLVRGMAARQSLLQALQACGDLCEDLADTIRRASSHIRDQLVNDCSAASLLRSAVWGLINTASYAEALTRVANLGGCASAAGALIGALAGATYRHSGIPADWRAQVHGTFPPRGGRLWREPDLLQVPPRLLAKG